MKKTICAIVIGLLTYQIQSAEPEFKDPPLDTYLEEEIQKHEVRRAFLFGKYFSNCYNCRNNSYNY